MYEYVKDDIAVIFLFCASMLLHFYAPTLICFYTFMRLCFYTSCASA